MISELPYFTVGASYGGNQDWMPDPWMKLGGCAALTAVDSCIYMTLFRRVKGLCPIDAYKLTKTSYINFANIMKPYIPPRFKGVHKPEMYVEGFSRYLSERGVTALGMDVLKMGCPVQEAEAAVISQIGGGNVIPMLHLTPKCAEAEDYEWHWFLLTGYDGTESAMKVKTVTYGKASWISLASLWDERDRSNGGLILYRDR